MSGTEHDFDRISAALLDVLPRFTIEEQRLAIVVYRLLAGGEPVGYERIAEAGKTSRDRVAALLSGEALRPFVYEDEPGRVVGFGGLAVLPMHHCFQVGERTLYTWCAWDTLFIPEMLEARARVVSPDPETGTPIQFAVGPTGIASASYPSTVVSFLLPDGFRDAAAKTIASFCHYVFFFESRQAGARWTARHPGTFLLSLEQAFELGRRKNAAQFGDALREARAEPLSRR